VGLFNGGLTMLPPEENAICLQQRFALRALRLLVTLRPPTAKANAIAQILPTKRSHNIPKT
jgi:hypothetical protein